MGFGVKWIKVCITTASFSVLVNGSPTGFFHSSRGLRQGDPLSPFLFIIVTEALSRLTKKLEESGLLAGFLVSEGAPPISHLQFADDTLFLCEANHLQLRLLRCTLRCFEAVSGLRINLMKSSIFAVGEVINIEELAADLGCKVGCLPSSYLGLPLGAKYRSKAIWDPVVERFERRLASWKKVYLSKGGKLTLIHSTLSSLPTYSLSLFTIPSSVAARIEKIKRYFLWQGRTEEFKSHLVEWNKVCRPKEEGGLGLRPVKLMNQALLGKWLWRFGEERDSLWRTIITSKYGSRNRDWDSNEVLSSYGVCLWKGISKVFDDFIKGIRLKVGMGDRVRFWEDLWCGDTPLKLSFPILYEAADNKGALVSSYMEREADRILWFNISMKRENFILIFVLYNPIRFSLIFWLGMHSTSPIPE